MESNSLLDNHQFVIPYELLLLLRWIIDNDPEGINDLVQKALDNGLYEEIIKNQATSSNSNELQQSIADFFVLLETCIQETSHLTHDEIRHIEKMMIPAIGQIDSAECDEDTLATSVEQATISLQDDTKLNAKETLCKQILKNWNPQGTKHTLN